MYPSNISNYRCDVDDEKISFLEHSMWDNWSSHHITNKIPAYIQLTESSYNSFAPMETFRDDSILSHRISISNDASHVTIDSKNEQKIHLDEKPSFVVSNQSFHEKSAQVSSLFPLKNKLTASEISKQPASEAEILLRPLSAYNMFFQLQRRWIISHDFIHNLDNIPDHIDTYDDLVSLCNIRQMKFTLPQPKRRHRKSYNKISFRELSNHIAKKWKYMNTNDKKLYITFACQEKKKYEKEKKKIQQKQQDKQTKLIMKQKEVVIHRNNCIKKTTSYESYKKNSRNLRDDENQLSNHKSCSIQKEVGNEIVVFEEQEDSVICNIICRNSTTTAVGNNDQVEEILHHVVPQDGASVCISNNTNSLAPSTTITKEMETIERLSSPSNKYYSNMFDDETKTFLSNDDDVTQKRNVEFNATNSSMEQTCDLNNVFIGENYKSNNNMNHNNDSIDDNNYTDNAIEINNNSNNDLKSIEEMEEECDKRDEYIFHIMQRIQYRSILIKNWKHQQHQYCRSNKKRLPSKRAAAKHKFPKMFCNYNMKTDGGGSDKSSQSPSSIIKNESSVDPFICPHFNDPLMNNCSSNVMGKYMDCNVFFDIEDSSKKEGF